MAKTPLIALLPAFIVFIFLHLKKKDYNFVLFYISIVILELVLLAIEWYMVKQANYILFANEKNPSIAYFKIILITIMNYINSYSTIFYVITKSAQTAHFLGTILIIVLWSIIIKKYFTKKLNNLDHLFIMFNIVVLCFFPIVASNGWLSQESLITKWSNFSYDLSFRYIAPCFVLIFLSLYTFILNNISNTHFKKLLLFIISILTLLLSPGYSPLFKFISTADKAASWPSYYNIYDTLQRACIPDLPIIANEFIRKGNCVIYNDTIINNIKSDKYKTFTQGLTNGDLLINKLDFFQNIKILSLVIYYPFYSDVYAIAYDINGKELDKTYSLTPLNNNYKYLLFNEEGIIPYKITFYNKNNHKINNLVIYDRSQNNPNNSFNIWISGYTK